MTQDSDFRDRVLVTGCYRSGTTLVEKLLHSHPQVAIGAQPFSPLFWIAMEKFHGSMGITRRYPLGHLFGERGYGPKARDAFLGRLELSASDLDRLFSQLDPSEDFASSKIRTQRDRIDPGSFRSVLRQFLELLDELYPKEQGRIVGAKEIVCEEFMPFLLAHGHACILIIRDPRDVVASVHFGKRGEYTGAQRPVLNTLRLWRKSVAFAIELEGTPGFSWLRYEDLVGDPVRSMLALTSALGLEEFSSSTFDGELQDQSGEVWRANSSFEPHAGVSRGSVGSYRARLPNSVVRYIETLCLPEMRLIGYEADRATTFDPEVVRSYRDPFEETHSRFESGYSHAPVRVDAEIARFEGIASGELSAAEVQASYLFARTHAALRSAMQGTR